MSPEKATQMVKYDYCQQNMSVDDRPTNGYCLTALILETFQIDDVFVKVKKPPVSNASISALMNFNPTFDSYTLIHI